MLTERFVPHPPEDGHPRAPPRTPNAVSPSPAGGSLLSSEGPVMGFSEVHILSLQMSVRGCWRCHAVAVTTLQRPQSVMFVAICCPPLLNHSFSLFSYLLLCCKLHTLVSLFILWPLLTPSPKCCFSQVLAIKVKNLPHPLSQPAGELALLSSQQFPAQDGCSSKAGKGQEWREQKNFY